MSDDILKIVITTIASLASGIGLVYLKQSVSGRRKPTITIDAKQIKFTMSDRIDDTYKHNLCRSGVTYKTRRLDRVFSPISANIVSVDKDVIILEDDNNQYILYGVLSQVVEGVSILAGSTVGVVTNFVGGEGRLSISCVDKTETKQSINTKEILQ